MGDSEFVRGGDTLFFSSTSVTVSDQIAAVPEASTWAMMLIGFGELGFLSYRRTQRKGGLQFRLA